MLGDTLKVHFAGSEQIDFAIVARKAGVKYFLYTCFPFIAKQFGLDAYPITCKTLFPPNEIDKFATHAIMDSGIFTLVYGAMKGQKQSEAYMESYLDGIIRFVLENGIRSTVVECDCQGMLGPDVAWRFREKLGKAIPNQIMNVWHWPDGHKGLDRLIEYSSYISIVPHELKELKGKTYLEDTYRLACYIKNRKPEIKIHLMGCTTAEVLRKCNFCTTADSTSWQAVNRYGRIQGNHVRCIRPEVKDRCRQAVIETLNACSIEVTEKRIDYYSNYYMSAYLSKREYERLAGNQD